MHKTCLIFLMMLFSISFVKAQIGVMDADINKVPPSGLSKISTKDGRTYVRDKLGLAELVRTNNSYTNPSWLNIDKSKVGLSNVNNTSDVDKPISTATYNYIDATLAKLTGNNTYTGTNVFQNAVRLQNLNGAGEFLKIGLNGLVYLGEVSTLSVEGLNDSLSNKANKSSLNGMPKLAENNTYTGTNVFQNAVRLQNLNGAGEFLKVGLNGLVYLGDVSTLSVEGLNDSLANKANKSSLNEMPKLAENNTYTGTNVFQNAVRLQNLNGAGEFLKIGLNGLVYLDDVSTLSVTGLSDSLSNKVNKVAGKSLSANDYTTTEKNKLAGIATGATANSTDAQLRDRSTHTGTQAISTIVSLQDSLSNKVNKIAGKSLSANDYTTTEKNKLAGIATGATANSTDAQLRDRSTHTGTQAISTIVGLQTSLDSKYTLPAFTAGSIIFSNGTNLVQNNAQLFWDNTNNRFGIGTATPSGSAKVDIIGALKVTQTHGGSTFDNWLGYPDGNNYLRAGVHYFADKSAISRFVFDAGSSRAGINTTTPQATLDVQGSVRFGYTQKSANYTITTLDHFIEVTSNSPTLTLPSAVSVTAGFMCRVLNSGSGTVTVNTTASQTINGASTRTYTQWQSATFVSNGTNWVIF